MIVKTLLLYSEVLVNWRPYEADMHKGVSITIMKMAITTAFVR